MKDAEITLIRYRMERAKEALSAASLMYEKGHYNDAVNRLYYCPILEQKSHKNKKIYHKTKGPANARPIHLRMGRKL